MSLNILVVEDEFSIALDIEMRLRKMGYKVIGIADNADTAIRLADEESPDIVILDIHIEGDRNGIEAAKEIFNELGIPVVFLTAHADNTTFQEALQAEPYGYILKPFKDVDLKNALEIAMVKFRTDLEKRKKIEFAQTILATAMEKQTNTSFFIKEKNMVHKVELDEIYWLEALDNYTHIYANNTRYTVHSFLKDVISNLSEDKFIRTHRSYAVSRSKIKTIREDKVELLDHSEIPLSRSYKATMIESIRFL